MRKWQSQIRVRRARTARGDRVRILDTDAKMNGTPRIDAGVDELEGL